MDLVFTNNLGRQVSLTDKSPMNKKEKEPLKSLFLFKIIISEYYFIKMYVLSMFSIF